MVWSILHSKPRKGKGTTTKYLNDQENRDFESKMWTIRGLIVISIGFLIQLIDSFITII